MRLLHLLLLMLVAEEESVNAEVVYDGNSVSVPVRGVEIALSLMLVGV